MQMWHGRGGGGEGVVRGLGGLEGVDILVVVDGVCAFGEELCDEVREESCLELSKVLGRELYEESCEVLCEL